jgi:hypothetical protein
VAWWPVAGGPVAGGLVAGQRLYKSVTYKIKDQVFYTYQSLIKT